MFEIYISIGVLLILAGIVSSIYFIKILKNNPCEQSTITSLSQSLSSVFIGVFYILSAFVVSQLMANNEEIIADYGVANAAIMLDENIDTTTLIPSTTTVITSSSPMLSNHRHPNEDFLEKYHALLRNYSNTKQSRQMQSDTTEPAPVKKNCFEQNFVEISMTVYSFLHSVLALFMNKRKCSNNHAKRTSKKESTSDIPDAVYVDSKRRLVVKVLTFYLVPIACIIVIYIAMDQDMQSSFTLFNPNSLNLDLWNIIHKPLNATTKSTEVEDVIKSVYNIVNATQIITHRRPKQLEPCPEFTLIRKFITVLLLIFYIVAIFYGKIAQIKLSRTNRKLSQQQNISMLSFSLLWFSSIFEQFLQNYLLNIGRSTLLSDIGLSLGNLNHLSIIAENCLGRTKVLRKSNLVEPKV